MRQESHKVDLLNHPHSQCTSSSNNINHHSSGKQGVKKKRKTNKTFLPWSGRESEDAVVGEEADGVSEETDEGDAVGVDDVGSVEETGSVENPLIW